MLGTGKSFRTSRESDVVRSGCERATLWGKAGLRSGSVELACTIERSSRGTHKAYTVNGSGVRYAGYLGRMRVVTFVPTDLQLAAGAPGARRAFLNSALSQTDPRYYYQLARYRNALQQKNALLRGVVEPDAELLETYNRTLIEAGTHLMLARDLLIRELAERARIAHARFSGGEDLELAYEPNVAFEAADAETIAAALAARFAATAEAERARKASVAGPHRDDVRFTLGGLSLAAYGSQGQQRTAVLALKVAEYGAMRARADEAPLLLLDDVLSELDDQRARAFLTEIGAYEQAFVTATHLPGALAPDAHVARIENGALARYAVC